SIPRPSERCGHKPQGARVRGRTTSCWRCCHPQAGVGTEAAMVARSTRREFLSASSAALVGLAVGGEGAGASQAPADPVIDIHQHLGYNDRPDDVLLAHQRTMGVATTILLPAGRSVSRPSTHDGVSNGLQARCLGNEACAAFAKAHSSAFRFGANEV